MSQGQSLVVKNGRKLLNGYETVQICLPILLPLYYCIFFPTEGSYMLKTTHKQRSLP